MDSASPRGAISVTKEMGIDHADFFRILPSALGTANYKVDGRSIVLEDAGRRFEIDLCEEESRRIASITLPVTRVTLTLTGYEPDDAEKALGRFDRYYQRGGG